VRLAVWRGLPRPIAAGATSAGPLHAWPRPEAFRPALHLLDAPALLVFDAAARRWLRRDPLLPAFLSEASGELGAAQGFWSAEPVRFNAAGADDGSLVFYHPDSVGSVAALTDANGTLIEERAHYPFGSVRHLHRPGSVTGGTDFDFTGHERDRESGLVHMGARSYFDLAGVFLSPDPRFAAAAALGRGSEEDRKSFADYLANPQMGNLYAYALRQPLKYIDPDGLEARVSQGQGLVVTDSVNKIGDYRGSIDVFLATKAGRSLVQNVRIRRGTIVLREGPVRGDTSQLDYDPVTRTGVITIDFDKHVDRARNDRWLENRKDLIGTITNNVARDLNWEIRKIDLSINIQSLGDDLQDLRVLGESTDKRMMQHRLDQTFLANPAADPQHTVYEGERAAAPKSFWRLRAIEQSRE
jgi:RHS repeat-associated protein